MRRNVCRRVLDRDGYSVKVYLTSKDSCHVVHTLPLARCHANTEHPAAETMIELCSGLITTWVRCTIGLPDSGPRSQVSGEILQLAMGVG
jgi:hypothetical protein